MIKELRKEKLLNKILDKEVLKPSIFGSFDGLTSLLGVFIPLLKYTHLLVFVTCLGLAVASAVSMGFGEFLSSGKELKLGRKIHNSTYMGIFTGLGCFVPVIPFAFTGGTLALVLSIGIYLVMTLTVSWMKAIDIGWKASLVQTFVVSLVAVLVVVLTTLVLPVPAG